MLEQTILSHLVFNDEYARRVLPYLHDQYFSEHDQKQVFNLVEEYVMQYNGLPTKEALLIELDKKTNLSETVFTATKKLINDLSVEASDTQWLLDTTEKFCQDKAIYNAILESVAILDDKTKSKGLIPELLSTALAISFDTHIGHDYIEDAEKRFEYYTRKLEKIPFNIDLLNKVTHGGAERKTLNLIMAGVHVGKSMLLCHMAADYLAQGHNVLYITLEMAEEKIAQRIDANLLDIPINELATTPKSMFDGKMAKLKRKTEGRLKIREFGAGSVTVLHLDHLLRELKIKEKFVPDVVCLDYMNLMASYRFKSNGNASLYQYTKGIAEELHGWAKTNNLVLWTATQANRTGATDSDPEMDSVSDSYGTPMTADFMIAVVRNETMDELGQLMIKQLKNRYGDKGYYNKFVVGVDMHKMRLYDVEQEAQDNIISSGKKDTDDKSPFDNSDFGQGVADESRKDKWKRLKISV
jgi:replicative DNA helicase